MRQYDVLGLMSGTSLDGLDILHVRFEQLPERKWNYTLLEAETIGYPEVLSERLASAMQLSGLELALLHADYGHFVGRQIRAFVDRHHIAPQFAAVHGHTVFHQPERGLTLQIGDGAAMAAESGLTIINDFRTADVALGGQGAPLVPIGDELLFPQYDFCLNLGGISNISYRKGKERCAFDISLCNIALNYCARRKGAAYDADGIWARSGTPVPELISRLDALAYYRQEPPKSLGFEWFEKEFLPVMADYGTVRIEDLLRSLVEHFAGQIARICREAGREMSLGQSKKTEEEYPQDGNRDDKSRKKMLITGGGARNLFLVERIAALSGMQVVEAESRLIEYKEALIFALLGVLRTEACANCLSSVTGAQRDNIGGAVYIAS